MGGTFDPVHHGHLVAASEVAHDFALDEVVFVPTGEPYQKDYRGVAPAEDRYLMTVIATASNPKFSVSRVDIDRPGPTYTIDTLRDLRAAAGPQDELFFITGADALAKMLTWHDVDELFTLAHFVGCTRPGHRLSGAGLPDGKVSLVEIPALAISSTECRARVEAGQPVWYLVPDGVVQYIAKRRLYAKLAVHQGEDTPAVPGVAERHERPVPWSWLVDSLRPRRLAGHHLGIAGEPSVVIAGVVRVHWISPFHPAAERDAQRNAHAVGNHGKECWKVEAGTTVHRNGTPSVRG
jgi:nicotinate-nucleotide adenylyltransferase